jgi:hypothetical protein
MVMALSILLALAGLFVVARYGSLDLSQAALPSRRFPRYATEAAICGAAGIVAGVLAGGAAGRLVMRLLALTSPPSADGLATEGGAIVGEITMSGTLSFFTFTAALGFASGLVYALVRRVLPPGRAGGVSFGVLVLIAAGSRIEPFRTENFDFIILDPVWLAVVAFAAVAVFQGMLLAALAGLIGRSLPHIRRAWAVQRPLTGRQLIIGRVVLAAVVLVTLPGFVVAIADVLEAGRG